ncbi:hypothetical protein EDB83DRAFT_257119 [Lactarius deliciosus]|nr:hypothetical protein EDB83DRAFT_257119 [Lactarius deliciosus]
MAPRTSSIPRLKTPSSLSTNPMFLTTVVPSIISGLNPLPMLFLRPQARLLLRLLILTRSPRQVQSTKSSSPTPVSSPTSLTTSSTSSDSSTSSSKSTSTSQSSDTTTSTTSSTSTSSSTTSSTSSSSSTTSSPSSDTGTTTSSTPAISNLPLGGSTTRFTPNTPLST